MGGIDLDRTGGFSFDASAKVRRVAPLTAVPEARAVTAPRRTPRVNTDEIIALSSRLLSPWFPRLEDCRSVGGDQFLSDGWGVIYQLDLDQHRWKCGMAVGS